MTENAFPYKTEGHRHRPEIEQELAALGSPAPVTFVPHLLPLDQGELATCFAQLDRADLQGRRSRRSTASATPASPSSASSTARPTCATLRDTNECHVYVTVEERGRVMAFSAIDNIWKGASGQGVQNLNLMLGLDETEGLREPGSGRAASIRRASSGRAGSSRPAGVEELDPAQLAPGFRAGGAHCGLKGGGKTDVGLLVCDAEEVASALLLTRNASAAAPIRVCRDGVDRGRGPRRGRQLRQRQRRDRRAGLRRRAGDVRTGRGRARPASRSGRRRRDRHDRRAAADRARCCPGSTRPPAALSRRRRRRPSRTRS